MAMLLEMDLFIIQECKSILNHDIDKNCHLVLENYYRDLLDCEFDRPPDWPYIFQKVYLHACLKGRHEAAAWMQNVLFKTLDPIQQIALRQIFPYGRVLLARSLQYTGAA
jgi:hypothetical protein